MRVFEGVALGYLALFALAAPFLRLAPRRRARGALVAGACALGVVLAAQTLPLAVRMWLPLVYLPVGYWVPALLAPEPTATLLESWLVRSDAALRRRASVLPVWLASLLELAYLACYPLVPVAFAVAWMRGAQADLDRFWLAVLTAGYVCYGTLPWLVSRPPRLLERPPAAPTGAARANLTVLSRVSHQLNTFPSGHVAVASAAAVVVSSIWWPAGIALWALTAGIAAGAVAGRYHFTVDVALGVVVGVLAGLLHP